jgi:protoheme IX farnesyltransferase
MVAMADTGLIKRYYLLTKPGVTYGNVLTVIAGLLLASHGRVDARLLVLTTLGMTLVIAAACVINNVLDRDIDRVMERTKTRPTVTGAVQPRPATVFGAALAVVGLAVLAAWTNWLVVVVAVAGFVDYVWLYGAWSKRRSVHGTLVGSISGAAPILAGYVAVSGRIDVGAVLVFAILFLWQEPEFYSIAIFRRQEYAAAGVPVIAVVKGVEHTKREILGYTVAFVIATLALSIAGVTGRVYLVVMAALGGYWLGLGLRGLRLKGDEAKNAAWARQMFRWSLIMLLVFSALISVDAYLP